MQRRVFGEMKEREREIEKEVLVKRDSYKERERER
jgi:hypothetical protein